MSVSCFLRKATTNVFFLVAAVLASCSAKQDDIIQGPVPINASLGAMVKYSCFVEGTILFWLNNGSSSFPSNVDHEMKIEEISENPAITSSNLTFIATSQMNGSRIACHTLNSNATVTLLIQGPLEAVGNLTAVIGENMSMADEGIVTYRLSWDPPYTVIGVPILGYQVNSSGLHSKMLISKFFTTNTILQPVDICDNYNFSVTAINGAGDGKIASIFLYHLEAPSVLAANTMLTQPNSAELLVQADFTVMVNHSCVGKIQEYAKATVNGQVHTYGPFLPSDNKIFFIIKELTRSQHYNISVWVENVDGKSNAIEMALSTFAVQGIDYSIDGQGALCIECLFSSGLSSSGCFVMLSAVNGQGSVIVYISRSNDAPSAIGCIDNFVTGVYNFTVYDALNNGEKQDTMAFARDNVTIATSSPDVPTTFATDTQDSVTTIVTEITTPVNNTSQDFPIVGIAVAVGLLGGTIVLALVIFIISYIILKQKRTKQWTFRNVRQRRPESFFQRRLNEYETCHLPGLNSPEQQNSSHVGTDIDMMVREIPPIPPAEPYRRSLILERETQVTTDTHQRSNSQPVLGGGGVGEQSSDHTSFRVTTPLRDAATSIIADPTALNTSVMESPPSYMNLTLNTTHHVQGSSIASEDTRRLHIDNETGSYDHLDHEPKEDYGRQMHLQYYLQSMMENSQHDFDQSCTEEFARHRTREVEYAQLDVNALQRRQSEDDSRGPSLPYQASENSERVQYAAVVHSPYKHHHFFSQTDSGSLV